MWKERLTINMEGGHLSMLQTLRGWVVRVYMKLLSHLELMFMHLLDMLLPICILQVQFTAAQHHQSMDKEVMLTKCSLPFMETSMLLLYTKGQTTCNPALKVQQCTVESHQETLVQTTAQQTLLSDNHRHT